MDLQKLRHINLEFRVYRDIGISGLGFSALRLRAKRLHDSLYIYIHTCYERLNAIVSVRRYAEGLGMYEK